MDGHFVDICVCLLTFYNLHAVLNMASATTIYASLGNDISIKCPGQNVNIWLKLETSEFLVLCENGLQQINENLSISSKLNITNDCNGLRIHNLVKEDSGVYICHTVNKETGSHKYEVNIKIRSITILEAQNASVMKRIEGQSVTLTCIVFGTPLGETLYLTTENKILASNDTNYVTYTFTAQRSHNMEEFMCNSNSSLGSDQATVKLILMIRPVTPINMQCVALYTEIIVKWQAGCSDVQQQTFLVEYQHRFQSKWSTVYSENTTSLTIHGLKQDMVYFVRMFARTEAGDSNKTKEIIAKTGKRPSHCYTLEFAVSLVGILSVILVCWCWRNGSKYIPCLKRNQCRIISSRENDTAQDRAGTHYDEIESIQFDTESPNIIPEGNITPSKQHEQVKPILTSHNDNVLEHINSIFVLNINGESEKSPHVTGKRENRKYSGGSTSEESHLVQNSQCIDISDVNEGQSESREECLANGNDSPTSRKSQKSDSETELKSIRKYESLVQTNTVEHYNELSVVMIHNI